MCAVPPEEGATLAAGGAVIREGEATLAEDGAAIPERGGTLKPRGTFPGGLLKILRSLLGTPVGINPPERTAPMPPNVRP